MHDVTESAEAVVDIWPYVDTLLDSDLEGLHPHDVDFVYRDGESKYDHVLLGTCEDNIYVVIIIDLGLRMITGHHLLNLNQLYGLSDEKV